MSLQTSTRPTPLLDWEMAHYLRRMTSLSHVTLPPDVPGNYLCRKPTRTADLNNTAKLLDLKIHGKTSLKNRY